MAWLYILIVIVSISLGLLFAALLTHRSYYRCKSCGRKFRPEFSQSFCVPHVNDEYMLKCPYCEKKDWCQIILGKNKDEEE